MFREQHRREVAIVPGHALSSHPCQPGQCAPLRREGPRQVVVMEAPGTTEAEERGEQWSAIQALRTSQPSVIGLSPLPQSPQQSMHDSAGTSYHRKKDCQVCHW